MRLLTFAVGNTFLIFVVGETLSQWIVKTEDQQEGELPEGIQCKEINWLPKP